MKKMIVLDECFQCPHCFQAYPNGMLLCDPKEKDIPNGFKIPTWCPLPDVPTSEGSK